MVICTLLAPQQTKNLSRGYNFLIRSNLSRFLSVIFHRILAVTPEAGLAAGEQLAALGEQHSGAVGVRVDGVACAVVGQRDIIKR